MKVLINESQIRAAVSRILLEQESTAPSSNNFILGMENAQIASSREDVLRLINFIFFNVDPEKPESNTELTDRLETAKYGYKYGQLCKDLREQNLDKFTLNDVIGLYLASRFADTDFDSNTLRPVQVGSSGIKVQDILLNLNTILNDFKFTQTIGDVVKFLKLFVSGGLESRYAPPAPGEALPSFVSRGVSPDSSPITTTYDELYRKLLEGSAGDLRQYVQDLHNWTAEVISPIAGRAEKIYNTISNPGLDVLYAGDLKTIAETMVQNHKNPATIPYTAIRSSMLADFALINSANRAYIAGTALEGATVGIGVLSLIAGKAITDYFAKNEVFPRFTSWFWKDVSKIESKTATTLKEIETMVAASQRSKDSLTAQNYARLLNEKKAIDTEIEIQLQRLGVETESLKQMGLPTAVRPRSSGVGLSSRASGIQQGISLRVEYDKQYAQVAKAANSAKQALLNRRASATPADIAAEMRTTDPRSAAFYEKYVIRGEPAPGREAPEGALDAFSRARDATRASEEAQTKLAAKDQQIADATIPEYFALEAEIQNQKKLVENFTLLKTKLQDGTGLNEQEVNRLFEEVGGRKALRTGAWSGSLLTAYAMTMGGIFLTLLYVKETLTWESTLSVFEGYVKHSLDGRMSVAAGASPRGSARPLGAYSSTLNPVQDACEDWASPFEITKQFQSATGQIDSKDYTDLAKAAGKFAKEANLAGVTSQTATALESALAKVNK